MNQSAMEQLTPRHFEIIDLTIQGLKSGQIADRLGLSHPYVSTVMAAPNFQHSLAMRRASFVDKLDEKVINTTVEAGNILKEAAVRAANNLVNKLDCSSDPLQVKAACEILDRSGVPKQAPSSVTMTQQVVIIDEKSAKVIQEMLLIEKDL